MKHTHDVAVLAAAKVMNKQNLDASRRIDLVLRMLTATVRVEDMGLLHRISDSIIRDILNDPERFSATEPERLAGVAQSMLPDPAECEVHLPEGYREIHIRDAYPMAEAEREAAAQRAKESK